MDLICLVRTGKCVASEDHGETSLENALVLPQDHNGQHGLVKWAYWTRSLANRSYVGGTMEEGESGMLYIMRERMG